jgi:hypothetical protein
MEKLHCVMCRLVQQNQEERRLEKTQRKRGKQIIYSHEDKPKTFATLEAMERDSTDPILSLFFNQFQFL